MKTHLFLLGFIMIEIAILFWIRDMDFNFNSFIEKGFSKQCLCLKDSHLLELNSIYSYLRLSLKNKLPPSSSSLQKFKNILNEIATNERDTIAVTENRQTSPKTLDVCPEEYYGWMNKSSSKKGFQITNCTNVHPIAKVLSVVITFDSIFECSMNLPNILSGLNVFYPTISIYIPSNFVECTDVIWNNKIVYVPVKDDWNSGKIWNKLITAVVTPYVLIGRDLDYFDNFSQIERQIRMVSYIPEIKIAGGSQRNSTGHWQVGCYQIHLYNYILEYLEGYYVSRNECMVCDHLLGSFVSTKTFLRKYPFDEKLSSSLIFEDFFIRVKQDHNSLVNCPDAMYFSTNPHEHTRIADKTVWLPLVKKLELNRIILPNNVKHSFSCSDCNISCGNRLFHETKWFLLPLCCIEKISHLVNVFHNICIENNITYVLRDGTLLGAVKMNGLMPWDIDGDISIFKKDYDFYISVQEKFENQSLLLNGCSPPTNSHTGNCQLWIDGMFFDLWGVYAASQDLPLPTIFQNIPTKQRFLHTWMYTETSPGYFARKRFGREMLRHSNNWRHLSISAYSQYNTSTFIKCAKPDHHACEDKFETDGSLQFYMP